MSRGQRLTDELRSLIWIYMTDHDLTRGALAKLVGVDGSSVMKWVNGKSKHIRNADAWEKLEALLRGHFPNEAVESALTVKPRSEFEIQDDANNYGTIPPEAAIIGMIWANLPRNEQVRIEQIIRQAELENRTRISEDKE